MQLKTNNNSGVVLIVVLWVLVILSVLAIGLSRQTGVDLQLTKNNLGQIRSRYVALAALQYAAVLMDQDSRHDSDRHWDTGYQCGFVLPEGKVPQDIFKDVEIEGGAFQISYQAEQGNGENIVHFGFRDEDGKVNLNAVDRQNYKVLLHLSLVLGLSEETAERIASAVVDWRDENNEVFNAPYGAEDDDYSSLEQPYHCKNGPFESLDELRLVQGMTEEIFARLRPYVTVFPERGGLLVNVNTASRPVLRAFARSYADAQTNTGTYDADSLVEKILAYRAGDDGIELTADDRRVQLSGLGSNAAERVVAAQMKKHWSEVSDYLRVGIQSFDAVSSARTEVEAVIARDDGRIVWWRRQ